MFRAKILQNFLGAGRLPAGSHRRTDLIKAMQPFVQATRLRMRWIRRLHQLDSVAHEAFETVGSRRVQTSESGIDFLGERTHESIPN